MVCTPTAPRSLPELTVSNRRAQPPLSRPHSCTVRTLSPAPPPATRLQDRHVIPPIAPHLPSLRTCTARPYCPLLQVVSDPTIPWHSPAQSAPSHNVVARRCIEDWPAQGHVESGEIAHDVRIVRLRHILAWYVLRAAPHARDHHLLERIEDLAGRVDAPTLYTGQVSTRPCCGRTRTQPAKVYLPQSNCQMFGNARA
ncbi:uncharacterized protein LAESUDRAFT_728903 [Laetiporus sulphureus 93-53]|uniref:Uncharacterized protein n=1 Tax=Laetiporus sulphureus 93-53 TaxID=1314785 RepID=A0A165CX08_9APHY|nr:uncharacterized protein LAESUDRAFT_728903 [Laetiporus sulphureus 93-53]KZT03625.1 hypothetical protein LAESUDRAFT_728903 [Laetiporus sulphureus 93-53]